MSSARAPFSSLAYALDASRSYVDQDIMQGSSFYPPSQQPFKIPSSSTGPTVPCSTMSSPPSPFALESTEASGLPILCEIQAGVRARPALPTLSTAASAPPSTAHESQPWPSSTPKSWETPSSWDVKPVRTLSLTPELRFPLVKPEPCTDDCVIPACPSTASSPPSPCRPLSSSPPSSHLSLDEPEPWIPRSLEELLSPPAPKCVPLRTTGASPEMRRMMGVFRLDPFARHDGVNAAVRGGLANEESSGVRLRDRAICWNGEQAGALKEQSVLVEFQVELENEDNLVPYQVQFPHLYPRSASPPSSPETPSPPTPGPGTSLLDAYYSFPPPPSPGFPTHGQFPYEYGPHGLPYALSDAGAVLFSYTPPDIQRYGIAPCAHPAAYNYGQGPMLNPDYAASEESAYYAQVYS